MLLMASMRWSSLTTPSSRTALGESYCTLLWRAYLIARFSRIVWSQRDPAPRKTGQGNIFVKNLDEGIGHKVRCVSVT
jgi:hypothetical protein